MDYTNKTPDWSAAGTEPPASLKSGGFTAGYKPPAAYFNWFWSLVSKNLAEIKTKLSAADATATAGKTTADALKNSLKSVTVTLYVNQWTGTSAPYSQTVTVTGMTADWVAGVPVIVPYDNDMATLQKEQEALECVSQITSKADALTFICYETKPSNFVTIKIPGVM